MSSDDNASLASQLAELKTEHRKLDETIAGIHRGPGCDELQLKRMKVRKLRLKDMIAYTENKLIPDLDA